MTVCEKCGKNFSRLDHLLRHSKTSCHQQQIQKRYECSECHEKFARKDTLVRHVSFRHIKEKSFECFHCSRKFTLKNYLEQHIRRMHINKKKPPGEEDKVCKRCKKKFVNIYKLTFHNKTVHRTSVKPGRNLPIFECNECNAKFTRRDVLVRHIQYGHMFQKKSFACIYCSRKYTREFSLRQHIRLSHSQNAPNCNKKIRDNSRVKEFTCLICHQAFDTIGLMSDHYEKDHLIPYVYERFEFASYTEFENWMYNERKMYIQCYLRNHWETDTYVAKVFRCHRSGEKVEKSAPKRNPKRSGSKKLNGFCPMHITLKESKIDGKCSVNYQKTHVGHSCEENELPYIRLTEKKPLPIIEATESTILTKNKSSEPDGGNSPPYILCHDHTMNTSLRFVISKRCSSAFVDESLNIRNFVIKNSDSVLFYKVQGEYDERFTTLEKDDFALGYMDIDQERALTRYGHKIVAFSGTHGTNPSDFVLHSMSVQDVDYEGYPVAFMLSNKNDKVVINILLQHIKQRVGIVKPKVIMSDMQHFYFNAWTEEMGPVPNRLYCTWNVHEAWRRNYLKINNKELRQSVKRAVENLSREPDKEQFEQKLNDLMKNHDVELLNFLKYFSTYASTKEYWAYCYRKHIDYSTNMGLETFHKTFKEKAAGGIKIKSVYECLCLLQTYLRWKKNGNEKKSRSGKICHKTRTLRKTHREAEKQYRSKEILVKRITNTCWQVQSFQNTAGDVLEELYTVQKLEVKECDQYSDIICSLRCTECKICHHDFVCSCPINAIQNYMCKHIHTLGLYLLTQEINKNLEKEDCTREQMTHAKDDTNQEGTAHIEEALNLEEMMYEEDLKQEEIVYIDEDFNQEEVVHVVDNFSLTNPADEGVKLECCRNQILCQIQRVSPDTYIPADLEEIYEVYSS